MVFDKPNPNKIAEELASREAATKDAEEKARLAKEKAAQEPAEKDKAKQAAEARQQATLAAMRANLGGGSQAAKEHTTTSVVVKKGNKTAAIEARLRGAAKTVTRTDQGHTALEDAVSQGGQLVRLAVGGKFSQFFFGGQFFLIKSGRLRYRRWLLNLLIDNLLRHWRVCSAAKQQGNECERHEGCEAL